MTSISADLHKYGFAAKGASVVLYRDAELRRHQFFVYTDWTGGVMVSPSMTGTRPGGAIAAAWATLQAVGEEGYLKNAAEIMKTTRALQEGVKSIDGLKISGQPVMSVFAVEALSDSSLDLFAVADVMQSKGWYLDRQQNPTSLHLMVTPAHAPIVDAFINDLRESVAYVKANPSLSGEGMAALYGMMAKIPDRSKVSEFLLQLMDERYQS